MSYYFFVLPLTQPRPAAPSSDVIRLNVGGTPFVTSRSTLTAVKGTMLDSMLSGRFKVRSRRATERELVRFANKHASGEIGEKKRVTCWSLLRVGFRERESEREKKNERQRQREREGERVMLL